MAAELIDGKALAARMRSDIATRADALRAAGAPPRLACVLLADDPAAVSYAASQEKHAASVGIDFQLCRPTGATQCDAESLIASLNDDATVHAIILQLPVPDGLNGFALQQCIAPEKDVEGVGAANLGLLAMGRDALAPCTAAAALACCQATGIDLTGKHAVVVGRSVIVGKPLAMLLLAEHCTVTQCHTRTRGLAEHTRRADVLFVAAGKAGLIGAEHVSAGTIVIDVGTHRVSVTDASGATRKTMVGDVRFEEVAPIAGYLTPVPGGVGPVTVALLLANTVSACERARETRGNS